MKRSFIALMLGSLALPALAQNVYVTGSRLVDSEVMPSMGTMNATLGSILATQQNIGGAINENSDKVTAMMQENGKNQQEYSSFAQESQNLERARQSFTVPDSICSESASGQAAQIAGKASALQGKLASGGGVSKTAISRVLREAPPSPDQDHYGTASIHADYCSAADYAAYGGTRLCNQESKMPGGDTELRSVINGAGPEDKTPDLTFSQDQTDAAMMYMKNSTRHVAGKQLTKGEVTTASGQQYLGLMDEYQAIESAAEQPQVEMVANSQPNPETKDALAEDLQTPSAKAYYDATASDEAKSTGEMSQREFETFEVGRRYASTDYQSDLQAMDGDNLTRESIRVQNLQNWLLLGIKQQLAETAIISGQQLSLAAAAAYQPVLSQKLQQVNAGVSR
ncbi:TPA: conjugal transfer protein TraW [Salmonella enterica]|nr:conjugal transfer protein TraW [Salmonella enterica]HCL5083770.1 conjugal transfer protein TraW [Salmonella enterica]